jgi:hypothetical protein
MEIREIDENLREEIEQYLFLDEDDLYSLIPPYSDKYKDALFAPTGQIEAGKKEFQALLEPLYQQICHEWNLCQKIDDPILADNVNLVLTIAYIIAPLVVGLPLYIIASILVKIDLTKFCDCR